MTSQTPKSLGGSSLFSGQVYTSVQPHSFTPNKSAIEPCLTNDEYREVTKWSYLEEGDPKPMGTGISSRPIPRPRKFTKDYPQSFISKANSNKTALDSSDRQLVLEDKPCATTGQLFNRRPEDHNETFGGQYSQPYIRNAEATHDQYSISHTVGDESARDRCSTQFPGPYIRKAEDAAADCSSQFTAPAQRTPFDDCDKNLSAEFHNPYPFRHDNNSDPGWTELNLQPQGTYFDGGNKDPCATEYPSPHIRRAEDNAGACSTELNPQSQRTYFDGGNTDLCAQFPNPYIRKGEDKSGPCSTKPSPPPHLEDSHKDPFADYPAERTYFGESNPNLFTDYASQYIGKADHNAELCPTEAPLLAQKYLLPSGCRTQAEQEPFVKEYLSPQISQFEPAADGGNFTNNQFNGVKDDFQTDNFHPEDDPQLAALDMQLFEAEQKSLAEMPPQATECNENVNQTRGTKRQRNFGYYDNLSARARNQSLSARKKCATVPKRTAYSVSPVRSKTPNCLSFAGVGRELAVYAIECAASVTAKSSNKGQRIYPEDTLMNIIKTIGNISI